MIMKDSATWKFISLKEYTVPLSSSKIRANLINFAELNNSNDHITSQRSDLLNAIEWKPLSKAFNDAIGCENRLPSRGLAHVCVGLFGSGANTLRSWASERDVHLLEAPSFDQLLDPGSSGWSLIQENDDIPLVIPSFEKCFLRHHRGLSWIEQIIEIVWTERRQIVIGCDLWAWKYLERALQIDVICPIPLISASLNSEQLRSWLPSLLKQKNLRFVVEGEDCFSVDSKKGTKFLDDLVEQSQGCMTLAWMIWQQLLLENGSKAVDGVIELCPKGTASSSSNSLTALESRQNLYVLHALLIHSGLSTNGLLALLPFPGTQIRKALIELASQGFLLEDRDGWEVTPSRYFDVLQQLKNRGFWIAKYGNE